MLRPSPEAVTRSAARAADDFSADAVSAQSEWLSRDIAGFAEALAWPA
jgi:hypothetical protein